MNCPTEYALTREFGAYRFKIEGETIVRLPPGDVFDDEGLTESTGDTCGANGLPFGRPGFWLNYTGETVHLVSGNPADETEDGIYNAEIEPADPGQEYSEENFDLPLGEHTIYDKSYFTTDGNGKKTFPRQIKIRVCWNRDMDMNQSGDGHAGGCCRVSIRSLVEIPYMGWLSFAQKNSERYLTQVFRTELDAFTAPGIGTNGPAIIPAGTVIGPVTEEGVLRIRDPHFYLQARPELNYYGSRGDFRYLFGVSGVPTVFDIYEDNDNPTDETFIERRLYSITSGNIISQTDTRKEVELRWSYVPVDGDFTPVGDGVDAGVAGKFVHEYRRRWTLGECVSEYMRRLEDTSFSTFWSEIVAYPFLFIGVKLALNFNYTGIYSDTLGQGDVTSDVWPGCANPNDTTEGCQESGSAPTPAQFPFAYTGSTYDAGGWVMMQPPSNANQGGTVDAETFADPEMLKLVLPNGKPLEGIPDPPLHLPSTIFVEPNDASNPTFDYDGGKFYATPVKRWWSAPYCRAIYKVSDGGNTTEIVQCTADLEGQGDVVVAPCAWVDWLPGSLGRLAPKEKLPKETDGDLMAEYALAFDKGETTWIVDYVCPNEQGLCQCGQPSPDEEPVDLETV